MILLRPREPNDWRFIVSSWLRSYNPETLSNERYAEERKRIEALLRSGTALVACEADDRDTILGWVCARGDELLYAYTKDGARRQGVCRLLCRSIFRNHPKFFCQNPTPRFEKIADKLGCEIRGQEKENAEAPAAPAGSVAEPAADNPS